MFNLFSKKIKGDVEKDFLVRRNQGRFSAINQSNPFVTGGSKYINGITGSGTTLRFDHYRLRMNMRRIMFDSPIARSIVNRLTTTIVDTGLRLECTIDKDLLGLSEDKAQRWCEDVEKKFHTWATDKRSSRLGVMNFYQLQRQYQFFQQRDNDIFIRIYYNYADKTLLNPIQLSFLDPNQITNGYNSTSETTDTTGLDCFCDGIERDNEGNEKTYNVLVRDRNYTYTNVKLPRLSKSGRVNVIHGFISEYAGQTRGYPVLSHAIQDLIHIQDFSLAQVQKAINQSHIMMYNESSGDADASNPFENITFGGAGIRTGSAQQTQALESEFTDELQYTTLPTASITAPGSIGVFGLKSGEKLKPFPNTAPSESYGVFVDSLVSYLTGSVDMPIEVLLMKFNQNYSASRATLLLFWKVVDFYRGEMASDFLNTVYEMWLSEEIASGRIKVSGWKNPHQKRAWLSCRWVGSSMPNIDPLKNAQAIKEHVDLGLTTLDREARNLNGTDGKTNRQKLKQELSELTRPIWNTKEDKPNESTDN